MATAKTYNYLIRFYLIVNYIANFISLIFFFVTFPKGSLRDWNRSIPKESLWEK